MSDILYGFITALSPINLIAACVSVAIGITIGALPGLSAAMGVALLIPITFGMPASTGLIVLAGVYCGAIFGGSISAILIRTPEHQQQQLLQLMDMNLQYKEKQEKP